MKEKVEKVVREVMNNDGKIPSTIVDEIFTLHNELFPNKKEFNKGCGTCRKRTYGRIQTYYNENFL